jgi:O-antigen/teichoic acid export membrane protein
VESSARLVQEDEMGNAIENLKALSTAVLAGAFFIAVASIPALFLLGGTWAAKHLLQPLIVIGWIAVALDVLVLLPLSVFRKIRGFTGAVIFISSFVFGLVTWLLGFILTYALWGIWGVLIGILLFGGAVVPFALMATMFEGMWDPFFTVLVLLIITFGSHTAGMLIAESTE